MLGKIVVIGDVMLDKYSYGDVKRLNPEGPNPLLHIHHEEYRLGGAANVAANIASLADSCDLIGMVGEDANTEIFMTACEEANIHLIPVLSSSPTITKWRFIENTYHQQMLRVDYEERVDIIGYQIEKISEALEQVSYEYIVISDYNKGMITPDLVHMLQTYAREKGARILVDSKPYNYDLFTQSYLIKPNFKEFCQMIGKEIENTDTAIEQAGKEFVQKMQANLVITRGKEGASLITKEGTYHHIRTVAQKVFDVTGAGDTFIATVAYALAHGYTLTQAIELGNKASGIVIEKVGTAVITKEELL